MRLQLLLAVAITVVCCAFAAKLREACSADSDCGGIERASCVESRCSCAASYVPDYDGTRCLHGSEVYGAPCRDTTECQSVLGSKAICQRKLLGNDTTERCLCMLGNHYNPQNYTCTKSLRLNDKCTGDVEGSCYLAVDGDHQHVRCASNGTCACEDGYAPDYTIMSCRIYKACSADVDCTEFVNAQCGNSGSCSCKAGYHAITDTDRRKIYCAKGLREECSAPSDCVSNAECRDGRCSCLPDYLPSFNGARCHHKAAAYNASCEQSWECSEAMGSLGRCNSTNGRCVCDPTAHYYNYTCYRTLTFGRACAGDVLGHCYMEGDGDSQHTACAANGTCACADGYFPSADLKHCSGAVRPWLAVGSALLFLLTRWMA
ncbi:tenascin-like isoform X1 [Schistocerca gregaria]|uniref:tenascin-like isoform X1 n=1 Tax=Schistocerca gregaria TaxID=7010 RepID=UPI00211DB115|nr:tenascin-like isoform X1 [Schistocerca gregaria]